MYSHILIPLDGSDRALAPVGPARRLARLHAAQLRLVTVATPNTRAEEIDAIVASGGDAAAAYEPGVITGPCYCARLPRWLRSAPCPVLTANTTRTR